MGDVSAWMAIGPSMGMALMIWGGFKLLRRYFDVSYERDDLKRSNARLVEELQAIRRTEMLGEDWNYMMPFPCDDAKLITVVSDRTPTREDRLVAQCKVTWLDTHNGTVWKCEEPGVWMNAGSNGARSPDSYVAVGENDDFYFMHAGTYPGFHALLQHILDERRGQLSYSDPMAVGIDPLPFILMDAGASGRQGRTSDNPWQAIRGLTPWGSAPEAAQPVAPPNPVRINPLIDGRRPIILDDPA